jgi:hypothetical protein
MSHFEETNPGLANFCQEFAKTLHQVGLALGGGAEINAIILLPIDGVKREIMLLQSKPEELVAALEASHLNCSHVGSAVITSSPDGEEMTATILPPRGNVQ